MKLTNVESVEDFLACVERCVGSVKLTSQEGDVFNIKSTLSCYVAIGQLIQERASELELFCDNKDDEALFLGFFNKHPESI